MNEQKNRVGLKHFHIFNHNIGYYNSIYAHSNVGLSFFFPYFSLEFIIRFVIICAFSNTFRLHAHPYDV